MFRGVYFIVFSFALLLFSCSGRKSNSEQKQHIKKDVVDVVKKQEKKENDKEKLLKMKIDRTKTPFAGVWEPSAKDSGFLLMFPDGKFKLFSKYDRYCKRKPVKEGTYRVAGERSIEFNYNGKKEVVKIKVISGFADIKGFGLYLLPQGLELKEENKEFKDPKELIKFCRNVNENSIGKIYPYLTEKSKIALIKVGILNQDYLAAHSKFTSSISEFLDPYKKIISIKSIKKEGNKEVFNIKLKDMEGVVYSENMTVENEGGNLRCGFFDNIKLVAERKDLKKLTFWYKEMVNSKSLHKFFLKTDAKDILKIRFDGNSIDLKEYKGGDIPVYELKGKFKIISNTANVVAIEVLKEENEDKKEKSGEAVVFKFGEDEKVNVILKDKVFIKMD